MRIFDTMVLTFAVALLVYSSARAQPPKQAKSPQGQEQPGQTEAAKPSDAPASPEAPKESKPSDAKPSEDKKRSRRKPVKVIDISPELATHKEAETLGGKFKELSAMRLRQDGSLLACDRDAKVIRVIDARGHEIDAIQLEFSPEALDIAADGTIYCGGKGKLAKLDATGQVLKIVSVPDEVAPTPPAREVPERSEPPETEKPASEEATPNVGQKEASVDNKEPSENADPAPVAEQPAAKPDPSTKPSDGSKPKRPTRRRKKSHPKQISGIAVSKGDVFVAFGSGWSTGSKSRLYRFDLELENPKQLAEGLRGCCQRCDIVACDGVLYLAENSAHRVVLYDREGNVLAKWGERGRDDLKTFGACCNPMNICFDAKGILYTSESGLGRVKRYTADGKYLDLVGYVGTNRFWHGSGLAASCSNMAIVATPDGDCVYVMDHRNKSIRVLRRKCATADAETKETGE